MLSFYPGVNMVDAVAVETVTEGVYRCRSALVRAVCDWVVLLAEIGACLRIIREGSIEEGRPALNAQTPPVGTVCLVIAIPTLQDVEVERDGDKRVRLEITKGQRNRLVNPDEMLGVIGRYCDDHRSTEFA